MADPTGADFGLRRPPLRRAVGLALAVGIGLTVAIVLWVSALGLDGEDGQALTDRLGTNGTLTIVTLIVVLTIIGPLQEEFLFRGRGLTRGVADRRRLYAGRSDAEP